jgi:hypothetical protein
MWPAYSYAQARPLQHLTSKQTKPTTLDTVSKQGRRMRKNVTCMHGVVRTCQRTSKEGQGLLSDSVGQSVLLVMWLAA